MSRMLNRSTDFLIQRRHSPRAAKAGAERPGRALFCLCFLLGHASSVSAETPEALVGSWTMPTFSGMAEECRDARWEFDDDGSMTSISGDQVVTGSYRTEPAGDGAHILVQTDLESNGQPNCQGVDAETVLENHLRRAYIVLEADRMTLHMGEGPEAPSFTMTRGQ